MMIATTNEEDIAMSAAELITKKSRRWELQRKQESTSAKTCRCRDCKDPVFNEGMCWDHYKEEHYLSK